MLAAMSSRGAAAPVLVTGAAGKTGRAVIGRLVAAQIPVRAWVRARRQRSVVESLGAGEAVEGDLRDAETAGRAAAGVGAVYHICPNVHPDEVVIGRTVLAAAVGARVERFVFHSVLHPMIEGMPHHWAKLRVEEMLRESGLAFTVLQPAPYLQNLLGQWRAIADDGIYRVPYGLEARVALVDLEDVAEVGVRVLSESRHAGATYELCGPDLPDQAEIAALLAAELGREVRAQVIPAEEWAAGAEAAGMGAYQVETLLKMFRYYERHGMAGGSRVLEWLLGRRPTGLAEFVARTASQPSPS